MKKLFFLIPAFVCIAIVASRGQQAFPTSSDAPFWNVYSNGEGLANDLYYQLVGSTTFCSYEWQVVEEYSSEQQSVRTVGYYREEGGKVYFRLSQDCQEIEHLMYDFTMEIGQTLNSFTFFAWSDTGLPIEFEVIGVDTIELGDGVPRRRLTLNYNSPAVTSGFTWWIEGIGDYINPFYPLAYGSSGDFIGFSLRCFHISGGLVYNLNCNREPLSNTRFYVDKDAVAGSNTGANWENAFISLQQALFFAGQGDSIWVAEGIYYPTLGDSREAAFTLKQGLALYGGFAGYEASLGQRRPWQHRVTLSGDINAPGDSTDNVYHVVKAIGIDSTCLLDGFVVENGQAVGGNPSLNTDNFGGGMYISNSEAQPSPSLRIFNCAFQNNTARQGAGMHIHTGVPTLNLPNIQHCRFENNNSLGTGGGLSVETSFAPDARLNLNRDTFENNAAFSEGGGVYFQNLRHIHARKCVLKQNTANEGGGIAYQTSFRDANADFLNCTFDRNSARVYGGFVFTPTGFDATLADSLIFTFDHCLFFKNEAAQDIGSAVAIVNSLRYQKVQFLNSTFEGNFPDDAIYGFFWQDSRSEWFIDKCLFKNNAPWPLSLGGGAIHLAGTIADGGPKTVQTYITNSLFTGNGGALSAATGIMGRFETLIKNCTFFNNGWYALAKNWSAGHDDSTWYNNMKVSNCILWEEETLLPGLESIFYNGVPDSPSLYDYSINNCVINASTCSGLGAAEACGEGLLFNIYPEFIDTVEKNLRLSACSPLLNKGSNMGLDTLGLFKDIDGNVRIQNGVVDIGAFEQALFSIAVDSLAAPSCIGETNGYALFEVNGTAPHEFFWSTADEKGTGTDMLASGDYTFIINDAFGCSDSIGLFIPQAIPVEIQVEIEPANALMPGSIVITNTYGGQPPYDYLWSTGAVSTTIAGLPSGAYSLTVTDNLGCKGVWTFEVDYINSQNEAVQKGQLSLSPNPVSQGHPIQLQLIGHTGKTIIDLYNGSGSLVKKQLQINNGLLPTHHLSPGLYLLVASGEQGRILGRSYFVVY